MKDLNTRDFKDLASKVSLTADEVLKGIEGYVNVVVTKFEEGSTVAFLNVEFQYDSKPDTSNVVRTIQNAVDSDTFYDLGIDKSTEIVKGKMFMPRHYNFVSKIDENR